MYAEKDNQECEDQSNYVHMFLYFVTRQTKYKSQLVVMYLFYLILVMRLILQSFDAESGLVNLAYNTS